MSKIEVGQPYRNKLSHNVVICVSRFGDQELDISPINENGDPTDMKVRTKTADFIERYELVA